MGSYITSSEKIWDFVRSSAGGFIFLTALLLPLPRGHWHLISICTEVRLKEVLKDCEFENYRLD